MSMNEELTTVNNQLQDKVEALEQANNDIVNLLAGTDIAMVFLDNAMHVKLFTQAISELLNLRRADIGRSISEISTNLTDDTLLSDADYVLKKLVPVEREVTSRQERRYLRRIQTHRTQDNRIQGLVITFVDITTLMRTEEELRTGEEKLKKLNKKLARSLFDNQQRLQAIVDNAADAILTIDHNGVIQDFSPAAEMIFGYHDGIAIGKKIGLFIPSLDFSLEILERPVWFESFVIRHEVSGRKWDGSEFPLEITVSEIDHLDLFIMLVRDISERRILEQEVIQMSSLEQERIGCELHDGILQQLYGMTMLASRLKKRLIDVRQSQAAAEIEQLVDNLQNTMGEARNLAVGMAPLKIDPSGLTAALLHLSEQIQQVSGIECQVDFPHSLEINIPLQVTHLYHIAQEALSNAVKHGKPTRISLSLKREAEDLILVIRDNGKGISAIKERAGRLGLQIMHYRAGILGGKLTVRPNDDGGTSVSCVVPVGKSLASK